LLHQRFLFENSPSTSDRGRQQMPTSASIKSKHTHGFRCSAIGRVYLHDTVNSEYQQSRLEACTTFNASSSNVLFSYWAAQRNQQYYLHGTKPHQVSPLQWPARRRFKPSITANSTPPQMFAVVQCSRSIHHCSQRIELHQHNFWMKMQGTF
jgi:hypothetical protein